MLNQLLYDLQCDIFKEMSFFSRIINKVYDVVQDDFTQHLTEHQVLAVINKQRKMSGLLSSSLLKQTSKNSQEDILQMAEKISQFTPQIEFRVLGEEPSLESIDERVKILKQKLSRIENYLVQNYDLYMKNVSLSLSYVQELKNCYNGRKKSQEVRGVIEKLKIVLIRGQNITRLSIHLNNLKNTIKLLETIPKTKNMTLIQLKAVDLNRMLKINDQIASQGRRLLCIDSLCSYITKVSNQEFVFVIDKIKICLTNFQEHSYEQLVRTFLIVAPSTTLHKLISSMLQGHLRMITDISIENESQINKISKDIIKVIINLHKLINWHKINKAVTSSHKINLKIQAKNSLVSKNTNLLKLYEQEQIRQRQQSTDSNISEEAQSNIEISDLIVIDDLSLKEVFAKTIDSCLTDIIQMNVLEAEMDLQRMYEYVYSFSKIAQICNSFTGLSLQKVKKTISNYISNRQLNMYSKNAKQIATTLQNQKNQWNRLPFKNDFRFRNIEKLILKAQKMMTMEEYKRANASIKKMMKDNHSQSASLSYLINQQQDENVQGEWECKQEKLPSIKKIDKDFQEWKPSEQFLKFYDGDTIMSQSSLKMLNIFQKHYDLAIMTNSIGESFIILEHLLLLIEYYIYYIFSSFLSGAYKRMFFEHFCNYDSLDKKYTKKRLTFIYPKLSNFASRFRKNVEQSNQNDSKLFAYFKKDIKQVSAQNSQTLRAKVVASESCKYIIAYYDQMLKKLVIKGEIYEKLGETKELINEVSLLLLSESSQKMIGLELQGMKSIFQSIRWNEPYQELSLYTGKVVSLTKESFEKLKSSSRGEIPLKIIYRIFILIWRTLITYAIKLFLENKGNNNLNSKKNFKIFVSDMYQSMENKNNQDLNQLQKAYNTFKSIFEIIICSERERSKNLLFETMKKYQYIFPIVIALFQNCQHMDNISEGQKDAEKKKFREELEQLINIEE